MIPPTCVQCGARVENGKELYREFSGGSLQLSRCDYCHEILDKYVEMDTVTILVDVLLLRLESYRHLMYNVCLSTPTLLRLTIFLLICGAYLKYVSCGVKLNDLEASQLMFYFMLMISLVELIVRVAILSFMISYIQQASYASAVAGTYKAVVISSFCKFLAIPVYIWAGDWGSLLPEVLQVATRFQVFKAMIGTNCDWVTYAFRLVTIDTVITCLLLYCLNQFCIQSHYKCLFELH